MYGLSGYTVNWSERNRAFFRSISICLHDAKLLSSEWAIAVPELKYPFNNFPRVVKLNSLMHLERRLRRNAVLAPVMAKVLESLVRTVESELRGRY